MTEHGVVSAQELTGHYDLVLVSPLKRTLATLHESQITYDKVLTSSLCREHKTDLCDFMADEKVLYETEPEILQRIAEFKQYLTTVKAAYQKILVVTHADFIWYLTSKVVQGERFGTWAENGELVELS